MENPYQNPEITQNNPLHTQSEITSPAQDPAKKQSKFTIPSDPKIRILLVMVIIIIVLLLISLVVSVTRGSNVPKLRPTPTPKMGAAIPTITPPAFIPDDIRNQFSEIDNQLKTEVKFNPPQIDETIGM